MFQSQTTKRRMATKKLKRDLQHAETLLDYERDKTEKLEGENKAIIDHAKRVEATIDSQNRTIVAQGESIAMFKVEALAAANTIAEMRGYIGRTLEDDRVREQPKIDCAQDSIVTTTTQNTPKMRPEPLRSGPPSMLPQIVYSGDVHYSDGLGGLSGRCATSRANSPTPWVNR